MLILGLSLIVIAIVLNLVGNSLYGYGNDENLPLVWLAFFILIFGIGLSYIGLLK